ncbi:MAG: cell division protein FtsL [Rhodobacteraceae bacterium]|nr:cell division protein FtsL [Paracoccaceae bacterium]
MGLAFWAYQENYRTQDAIKQVRGLHSELADARGRLGMLRAEWAYQNRPDRLRELARLNYDRLGLMPILPGAFGAIADVPVRPPELGPISGTIELSSEGLIAPTGQEEPL